MVNPRKIRAAISIGDPNGIGIEIILKFKILYYCFVLNFEICKNPSK